MERAAQIVARLTSHFAVLRYMSERDVFTLDQLGAGEWGQAGGRYRNVGWEAPRHVDGRWVARFCPEVMAATSASLSDTDFNAYLDAVQLIMDQTIIHHGDVPDDMLADRVEDWVADKYRGNMHLVSRVQLAAIG